MSQPAPIPNDLPAVWDLIIERMRQRDKIGRERYGTPLQPMNGRNALEDRIEEQLDALAYTVQDAEEMKELGRELVGVLKELERKQEAYLAMTLRAIIERYPVLREQ